MQDPDESHLRTFVKRGLKAQRAVDKLTGRGKSILMPKERARALARAEEERDEAQRVLRQAEAHRALLIEAVRYARRELRGWTWTDPADQAQVDRIMRRLNRAIERVNRKRHPL